MWLRIIQSVTVQCGELWSPNDIPIKHLVHELNEDDPDRPVEFCENMITRRTADFEFVACLLSRAYSTRFFSVELFKKEGVFQLAIIEYAPNLGQ